MSFRTPNISDVVQKTPDPLINLKETSADFQNQKNKRGLLSTFLQGSRNRTAGTLSQAFNNTRQTLGSGNV